jgi:hypothetical protein
MTPKYEFPDFLARLPSVGCHGCPMNNKTCGGLTPKKAKCAKLGVQKRSHKMYEEEQSIIPHLRCLERSNREIIYHVILTIPVLLFLLNL